MTVGDIDDPAVSFVIPTYEEEAFLPATLRSIRALDTDYSYEVLVVDGGSTDATVTSLGSTARQSTAATVLE